MHFIGVLLTLTLNTMHKLVTLLGLGGLALIMRRRK